VCPLPRLPRRLPSLRDRSGQTQTGKLICTT
jgi:hypothetical protein